jgi:hypothetical protein
MRTTWARRTAGVVCVGALVAACGGRSTLDDTAAGDASRTGDDAGAEASVPETSVPEASIPEASVLDAPAEVAPPDVASCDPLLPDLDGGTCNALQPLGDPVPVTCAPDPAPTPSGGTIVDGDYVLVASTFYLGCPYPGEDDRISWHLCGASWSTVQEETYSGATTVKSIHVTSQVQGTSAQLVPDCPAGLPPETFGYDATPDSLTFYVGVYGGPLRLDHLVKL